MAEIDHWHPVLRSDELARAPVGVRVAGHEIVLFRAGKHLLGALGDRCPHRGMRLSLGVVDGGRLVCPYHAWRWAPDGSGESPGTPEAKPCAERYDVVERHGILWVKRGGALAAFPRVDVNGYFEIARFRRRVPAPLEIVLDNFIEVEHTPTTHLVFGYPLERMAEVETRTTIGGAWVRVFNVGPQRELPLPLNALYGIPPDALFVDDWTTYFSPVHTVYDQYWVDPRTREQIREAFRIVVFFNPIGPEETELFVLAYTQSAPWGRLGVNSLLFPVTKAFLQVELDRDCRMLERLSGASTALKGNALGRFDKGIIAARRRIDHIYRGRAEGALPMVAEG